MYRAGDEVQNCKVSCHESFAEYFLEDVYRDLEVESPEFVEDDEESPTFEDLLHYVSSMQEVLTEVSKQMKKGVVENVEDFAVLDCGGGPTADAQWVIV